MYLNYATAIRACFCFSLFSISGMAAAQQPFLETHAVAVKQMAEKNHVVPKTLDDHFSIQLFDNFFDLIDPERIYFTKKDIALLQTFRIQLDDEFNTNKWAFVNAFTTIYLQCLKQSKNCIEKACLKPFDFTKYDFLNYTLDTSWATDENQLQEKWRQRLKRETLDFLSNLAESQLQKKGTIDKNFILKKEQEVRANIQKGYLTELKQMAASEQNLKNELAVIYLNSFLQCFDPHSAYFDTNDKKAFEQQLNTEGYYFGLMLGENDKKEVSISRITPGGAAWMSGELNKDDVVLELKWAGKESITTRGLSAREVAALLDGPDTDKLEITVRKTNGQITSVSLQKAVLENNDNIVKSFVLTGAQKIGYINLPSFYTEWEETAGSTCAADVAKEIIKLKKDNIEGLILDLRFNGGGSLTEAIEMAGIFIDEGALTQIKTKEPKPIVLKDANRGVIYSGPLVILINGQSASASELVAAALQDYNRAVIVGSPTYGKATGQTILPIEYNINIPDAEKGFVKLTTFQLYRVTGNSIQQKGVQPDILLPDIYENVVEKEDAHPFALTADTISFYKYFRPMVKTNLSAVKANSEQRVRSSENFKMLSTMAKAIELSYHNPKRSMKWDDREKEIIEAYANKKNDGIGFPVTKLYTAENNNNDKTLLARDIIYTEVNQHWLHKLSKDIYVEECYQILSDLIKLKNLNN